MWDYGKVHVAGYRDGDQHKDFSGILICHLNFRGSVGAEGKLS